MNYLDALENQSLFILREAYARFRSLAMLWSIGKDSTTMLWLARKAFFGKIPFPVVHIDTSYKFKEIYAFRDQYAKEWSLDLHIARNEEALNNGMHPATTDKFDCCNNLKTEPLKQILRQKKFDGLLLAIRRDEHGIRAKERYFSPRTKDFTWMYQEQPLEMSGQHTTVLKAHEHCRIHPLLHWREVDVWEYIQREKIPVVDLYFAKQGKRFRSIGCETCCAPVPSKANTIKKIVQELHTTKTAERSGRAQDKENLYTMQKLRSLGYM
jgi:sulfate adenylyltransferase subunit 2